MKAKILPGFQSPCVVKVTHSSGGRGVWFVKTREEYNAALQYMNHVIPDCEFITTELIEVSVYFAVNIFSNVEKN